MSQSLNRLEISIAKTLLWFQMFDYPLTAFEIWKWLYRPSRSYTLSEVYDVLYEDSKLAERIVVKNGFFAFDVSERVLSDMIKGRHERFIDAAYKYQRLRRVSRYLSVLPSVRAVAAVNNLSWWNTTKESDIDLFVLVEPGTVWSSRFLSVVPFLHHRPKRSAASPLCFSFFLTTDALDLSHFKIDANDPYLAYWTRALVPVFDKDGVFNALDKENMWAKKHLPNTRKPDFVDQIRAPSYSAPALFKGNVERALRYVQKKKMPKDLHNLADDENTCVVVNDRVLKFHENDRRKRYCRRWKEKMCEKLYGSTE